MSSKITGLVVGLFLVALALGASIALGKANIRFSIVIEAITDWDSSSRDHLIVRSVRVPRALIAMMVGACLAMAGAIMQAVTRNELAGPELFGINQGAALAMVLQMSLFGSLSAVGHIGFAFAGAGLAALAVYRLGSAGRQGLTPLKLILAGSTINLFFASLVQGLLIMDEQSLDSMRFWLAGSLTGRDIGLFMQVAPLMAAGIAGALILSRHINLISLGDEVAQGLGQRIAWIRTGGLLLVVVLAGASVAIAGPVGFIGLAVPHIVRAVAGADYRWILPYCAVAGALLLLLADIAARFVLPAQEVQAGVITALLGAPFLIYLAQRRG